MKAEDFDKQMDIAISKSKSEMVKARMFELLIEKICNDYGHRSKEDRLTTISTAMSYTASLAKTSGIDVESMANETLKRKANEYASDNDRLWNFKNGYTFMDYSSTNNLSGYLRKQASSVMDYLTGVIKFDRTTLSEKYGDCYNYLILLYALVEDKETEYGSKGQDVFCAQQVNGRIN